MQFLTPKHFAKPRGYAHGTAARGTLVAVAGQIGWDAQSQLVSPDFVRQLDKALENVVAVLREADARPEDTLSMRIYVADIREYAARTKEVGEVYRKHFGKHYPAMALFQVAALLQPGAKVEVEATAVVPDERSAP